MARLTATFLSLAVLSLLPPSAEADILPTGCVLQFETDIALCKELYDLQSDAWACCADASGYFFYECSGNHPAAEALLAELGHCLV